jgi:hypothetical protein
MGPVDFQLFSEELTRTIRAGVEALGIERLTLAIHDASFPSDRDEDVGRGTPYGKGGRALLGFAAGLGFDSVESIAVRRRPVHQESAVAGAGHAGRGSALGAALRRIAGAGR